MKQILLASALFASAFAYEQVPTLIKGESIMSVDETIKKLEKTITEAGVKVFSVIDHSKLAKEVGLEMAETKVVVYGAPKVGTLLMQCAPDVAIELPLKFMVSLQNGKTIVAYEDVASMTSRYGANKCEIVPKLSAAQQKFFKAVTK